MARNIRSVQVAVLRHLKTCQDELNRLLVEVEGRTGAAYDRGRFDLGDRWDEVRGETVVVFNKVMSLLDDTTREFQRSRGK